MASCKQGSHCWHDSGVLFTSHPPKTQDVCCECGETRYLELRTPLDEPVGHGPYHPRRRPAP